MASSARTTTRSMAALAALDLPRVPQQARSRQRRVTLLAAAARLFEEHGYDATTADDIAGGAGVSIGTFYAYFRNKRQVFLTLFATVAETILAQGLAELDLGVAPRQAIRAAVYQALERDPLSTSLRRAWRELLPRDPDLEGYTRELNQRLYEQILAAVRRVEALGQTWPGLDVEATCWAITQLIDQTWRTLPAPGEVPDRQRRRQMDALADLIYHALFRA